MKKNFEELYNDFMSDNNDELIEAMNQIKKDKRKRLVLSLSICSIVDVFMLLSIFTSSATAMPVYVLEMIMLNVGIIIISFIFFNKGARKLRSIFKEKVIGKLLHNFYDDITYTPNKGISSDIYDDGRYKESYNKYYSDDLMVAKVDKKYPIKMAEVETIKEETSKDSDGNISTSTYNIFHGLFGVIEMDKSINNDMYIFQGKTFSIKKDLKWTQKILKKYLM